MTDRKYSDYFKPMLATLVDEPFDDDRWVFELKLDGFRAVAEWDKKQVKLYSRNGLSFTHKFPSIVEEIRKLKQAVVLDGEIVMLNENNQPDFQKLQNYENNTHLPLVYYVFDLLFIDGKDVRELTLLERKQLLKKLLGKNSKLQYCDHFEKEGKVFF